MQLIQIGVTKQKTILDLIQEMAANQFSEIEQLKAAARSRAKSRRTRGTARRCGSSKVPAVMARHATSLPALG